MGKPLPAEVALEKEAPAVAAPAAVKKKIGPPGTPAEKPEPSAKKGQPEPDKEPEDDIEMTFIDHLRELRKYVVRALWGFIPGIVIAWMYREEILEFLTLPYVDAIRHLDIGPPQLHFSNPADLFVAYMMIAVVCGGIIGSPWAFAQIWSFIAPGLYRREKQLALPFVLLSTVFFVGGAFFGYAFVLPPAFTALFSFAGRLPGLDLTLQPTIMVNEYLDFSLRMLLALGITFEVPIVIGFISFAGLVNWRQLLAFSRWWVVISAVLAAVLTPSGDAGTMMLVLVPLVVLYYIGVLFAYLFGPKAPAASAAGAGKLGPEEDE
jgi:sec-independent protein translocase protein TatC